MEYVRVYNQDMQLLGILDNADGVGYELKHNDLSTATLSLPTPDEKNAYMAAHNIVRIFDGDEEVGLFRVIGEPENSNALEGWTEYTLEHVIATLVDDVLFGYHEIGGSGVYTRNVAEYILSQQTVRRWQLGRCDYSDQYSYKFENTNLLAALFSLGKVLTDDYQFTFDTTTTPWTVNLIRIDDSTDCEIRYRRNMQEITRSMDATALVTRLYLLGYGEGVNQLTIKSVNNGLPFVQADTVSVWGVKSSVFADTTIEDAALLKARGLALLEELKNPYIAYVATAIDLYRLTGLQWDKFMPGKKVHAYDDAAGIDFAARIVTKRKADVYGDPGSVELEIANRVQDIADSINKIAERQGIAELYSQGATNLYSQQYADNADTQHPAVMRFYVPSGCVRINSVRLSWDLSAFRAYETGAAAGGGTTVTSAGGGATTVTSGGGGGTTVTSAGGGATTVTSAGGGATTVTSAGGGATTVTSAGGGATTVTSEGGGATTVTSADGGAATVTSEGGGATTVTSGSGGGTTVTSGSGGGTTVTSAGGGATTVTSGSGGGTTVTSAGGGATTVTSEGGGATTVTSADGGAATVTSEGGGATTVTSGGGGGTTKTSGGGGATTVTSSGGGSETIIEEQRVITSAGATGVPLTLETQQARWGTSGPVDWFANPNISTSSAGAHTHSGPEHNHAMGHYHTGPSHTHALATHRHTLNSHKHSFSKTGNVDYVPSTVTISGDTGEPNPSNTGYSGELTTDSAGDSRTSNAQTYEGNGRIWTENGGTGNTSEAGAHTHNHNHTHEYNHMHLLTVGVTIPEQTISIASHTHGVTLSNHTHSITLDNHTHDVTLYNHTHDVELDDHTHSVTLYDHTHDVILDDHTHDVTLDDHTHDVTLDDHTHDVTLDDHTHDVTLDDHTHDVTLDDHTHDVTLEAHTHEMVYGIYEGGTASRVTIRVDGVAVPSGAVSANEMDVVAYLSKDNEGKINRGTWHTIEIVPNSLTRIEANLFVQAFVQSVGGGDY